MRGSKQEEGDLKRSHRTRDEDTTQGRSPEKGARARGERRALDEKRGAGGGGAAAERKPVATRSPLI